MKRLIPFALISLITLAPVSVEGAPAPASSRILAGTVSKVAPKGEWFMLDCTASKKYPRVKVTLTPSTEWPGPARPGRRVEVGDRLIVTGSGSATEYKAIKVRIPAGAPRVTSESTKMSR